MRQCPSTIRFIGVTFQCERKEPHNGWHQKHDEPYIRISWAKGTGRRLKPTSQLISKICKDDHTKGIFSPK